MKIYSLDACRNFIERYLEKENTTMDIIEEGVLGLGILVLTGPKLKTFIIKEIFLNAWSSGHTIRGYNKTPKKYDKLI